MINFETNRGSEKRRSPVEAPHAASPFKTIIKQEEPAKQVNQTAEQDAERIRKLRNVFFTADSQPEQPPIKSSWLGKLSIGICEFFGKKHERPSIVKVNAKYSSESALQGAGQARLEKATPELLQTQLKKTINNTDAPLFEPRTTEDTAIEIAKEYWSNDTALGRHHSQQVTVTPEVNDMVTKQKARAIERLYKEITADRVNYLSRQVRQWHNKLQNIINPDLKTTDINKTAAEFLYKNCHSQMKKYFSETEPLDLELQKKYYQVRAEDRDDSGKAYVTFADKKEFLVYQYHNALAMVENLEEIIEVVAEQVEIQQKKQGTDHIDDELENLKKKLFALQNELAYNSDFHEVVMPEVAFHLNDIIENLKLKQLVTHRGLAVLADPRTRGMMAEIAAGKKNLRERNKLITRFSSYLEQKGLSPRVCMAIVMALVVGVATALHGAVGFEAGQTSADDGSDSGLTFGTDSGHRSHDAYADSSSGLSKQSTLPETTTSAKEIIQNEEQRNLIGEAEEQIIQNNPRLQEYTNGLELIFKDTIVIKSGVHCCMSLEKNLKSSQGSSIDKYFPISEAGAVVHAWEFNDKSVVVFAIDNMTGKLIALEPDYKYGKYRVLCMQVTSDEGHFVNDSAGFFVIRIEVEDPVMGDWSMGFRPITVNSENAIKQIKFEKQEKIKRDEQLKLEQQRLEAQRIIDKIKEMDNMLDEEIKGDPFHFIVTAVSCQDFYEQHGLLPQLAGKLSQIGRTAPEYFLRCVDEFKGIYEKCDQEQNLMEQISQISKNRPKIFLSNIESIIKICINNQWAGWAQKLVEDISMAMQTNKSCANTFEFSVKQCHDLFKQLYEQAGLGTQLELDVQKAEQMPFE
ncbi:hypothetical protein AUJ29_00650 [Candidatus Kuenenbacteria bacterium CG1_02_38_13]|uniref:Uncharacterized protein n=1 Tax=Candidatus Kuenenbacteria bacterium CG1_02_38_13 TaxID=1805235 RepID=A0A1J4U0Y4_9BACT|nr:MAG: hypothetical protein AUJ29_00650 [Candidatus Kuenenbacteria bacterium CG1_02_38_13]